MGGWRFLFLDFTFWNQDLLLWEKKLFGDSYPNQGERRKSPEKADCMYVS